MRNPDGLEAILTEYFRVPIRLRTFSPRWLALPQSERFVEDLRDAGIPVDFLVADGTLHSIALLDDDLKRRIVAFFQRTLGPGAVPTAVAAE